ncbi:MAG: hypothetical protein KKB08_06780 [Gammaproteobacteria bacterium]|nr:hypothetical protein [Gammaproteobacteria bacterium]
MLYTHVAAAIGGAVLAGALAWNVQGWRLGEQIAAIQQKHTAAELRRSEAVRADENQTASKESTHAADTLKNSDEFTTSQPVRDAIARADLARADRLRTDAERRAATYRAQAQADDAARRGLADRLEAFDRQLVEGVAVVGELRTDLVRRDAEVVLLHKQVMTERALLAD